MSWLKGMLQKEPPEPTNPTGTVVIGNLQPDMMDTPKEMVRKALKRSQFRTIDLGPGASPTAFAAKAKEVNADIIAVSVNLTPAKNNLEKLMAAIESEGLTGKVAVIIGGAAVNKEDADKIGVLFGKTKEEAEVLAKKAMEEKQAKKQ
jgi:methanogenic corrinoid protein MtbC1